MSNQNDFLKFLGIKNGEVRALNGEIRLENFLTGLNKRNGVLEIAVPKKDYNPNFHQLIKPIFKEKGFNVSGIQFQDKKDESLYHIHFERYNKNA